jgi:hypothetical protein
MSGQKILPVKSLGQQQQVLSTPGAIFSLPAPRGRPSSTAPVVVNGQGGAAPEESSLGLEPLQEHVLFIGDQVDGEALLAFEYRAAHRKITQNQGMFRDRAPAPGVSR